MDIPAEAKVIDAHGKLLMPGVIDDQVHFREPGLTYKADIGTESTGCGSRAVLLRLWRCRMWNPQTVTQERLAEKFAIAGREIGCELFVLYGCNQ